MTKHPTLTYSTCAHFEFVVDVPKGRQASCSALGLTITAPIHMRKGDYVLIDTHGGKLHKIIRDGITIWREAWKN